MTLSDRLAFAQVFGELLAFPLISALGENKKTGTDQENAKERLRDLMGQVPESELADFSLGQIARLLQCGERHASRLFQEMFGTRFLVYVSELRLKKACDLLLECRLKIVDVALQSKHGSVAHFNYAFKKRFGLSPTAWREFNRTAKTRLPCPNPPQGRAVNPGNRTALSGAMQAAQAVMHANQGASDHGKGNDNRWQEPGPPEWQRFASGMPVAAP
ncbi:MAG: helix-turn-helix domain-containing protein [Limisphaerales bacterium]